jgi:hypothetical protein
VFVSVVVALGTEPELAVRSEGPSCASSALSVSVVLFPKSVEKTPSCTDCLVVVAGVNGGSALDSAVPGPCCSWVGGGAEAGEGDDGFMGRESSILWVLVYICCTSMHGRAAMRRRLGLLDVGCSVEEMRWHTKTRLAGFDPAWTTSHRQHIDTLTCLPESYTIPTALDLDKRLCMFLSRTHKKG